MIAVMNIMDKFELSSGITVLACKNYDSTINVIGKQLLLVRSDEVRQVLTIFGERKMLNQQLNKDQRAFETRDAILLSVDEARSGNWQLMKN
ncbi:hypothetical protein [Thiofilum flexile]|uniref:hypothetical protein n=1 Tax=Thiofilum flexile TaxID=125627 RepID=UPI00036E5E97|nr:hypothetical protein [Thiofilum flexile]